MKDLGLKGVIRGKPVRTTIPDKSAPCPLDRVNRQFRVPAPNMLWVSDFTYVATWQGFVHVAFVIDAFARRIVGWRVSRTGHAGFVLDALEQAVHQRRSGAGLVHHSDRGSQGGLNRSSQHPAEGGCDGEEKETFGQVGARQATLARPPRCGAARSFGGVLGGHRDRRVERSRGVCGGRVAGGRRPMVPEGRRHGADASGGFGAAADGSIPVLRRA
jgi:hypothetical protein